MRLSELFLCKSEKVRVNFNRNLAWESKKVRDNGWKVKSEYFLWGSVKQNWERNVEKVIAEVKGSGKFEDVE